RSPSTSRVWGQARKKTALARRQIVTVGVRCWAARCVRPVSTPTTARAAVTTSTASPGVGAGRGSIPPQPAGLSRVTTRTRDPGGGAAGGQARPPVLPPALGRAVAGRHEQHRRVEFGARPGGQRKRLGEVGVDTEVGADAIEDLVDGERPVRILELRRTPPVV